ncbi:T9SS type A sorting domain-containing protein [bacterium]|nr:T9SS type A sorting domain-containing protein [bacterium]
MPIQQARTLIICIIMAAASAGRAGHRVAQRFLLTYRGAPDIAIGRMSDGNTGIAAFRMLGDDRLALLCNGTNRIAVYSIPEGRLLRSLQLPVRPLDFTWSGSRFFVRCRESILVLDGEGVRQAVFPIAPSLRFISRLAWSDSTLFALTAEGYSFPLWREGRSLDADDQMQGRKRGWMLDSRTAAYPRILTEFTAEVRLYRDGESVALPVQSADPLGSLRVIGSVDSCLYLEIQTIVRQSPLKVNRTVACISTRDGQVLDAFEPPPSAFFPLAADLVCSGDRLFCMVTSPDSLTLYSLRRDPGVPKTLFPGTIPAYHYNDHLPERDRMSAPATPFSGPAMLDPIRRSAIMENADAYVQIEWMCGEANTSDNEIVTLPDGALIKTPYWVTIGPKKRTPYKWGGFTHVDIFEERIEAGCYAGDVYTDDLNRDNPNTVSSGDLYCVGVDCSGFVSRAWNQPVKHWTGSLPDISVPLERWADVQPGDIANRVAGHVMLIVYRNGSGSISIVHANGTFEDVSYGIKTLYDLSGYMPMRYAAVIDDDWEPEESEWTTLHQNYPNPVSGSTAISFYLAYESDVTIAVYNLLGQPVAVPFTGHAGEGTHTVSWNAQGLPSGLYFYQLRTFWDTLTKKCTIVR